MKAVKRRRMCWVLGACVLCGGAWLSGQEAPDNDDEADGPVVELESFEVIGSREAIFKLPGAGYYVPAAAMEEFKYDNINAVLAQVPGVYVRGEDGHGLFPNISLRGVDPGRSGKVTMMEDGVVIAPAPYSAPSAYYSPTTGRMSAIEVLKGSSQIAFGPHTTGGVINYISTPIPTDRSGLFEIGIGTDETLKTHLWYGDRINAGGQAFMYLGEIYHHRTDGFKTIAPAAGGGYAGSDDTGFERTDTMLKLGWMPTENHYLETKIAYTDLDANETYLGLTNEDFPVDPFMRYPASQKDRIQANHTTTYLRHRWTPGSDFNLTTTGYYNKFHRNWYKLDRVNGRSLSSVLSNNDPDYQALIGAAPGEMKVRANNRDYYSGGIQSVAQLNFETGSVDHELKAGLRLHTDQIDRFQHDDFYDQDATGNFGPIVRTAGPESAGDREQTSDAVSVFLEDRVRIGNVTLLPGLRYEYVEYDYIRRDGRDPAQTAQGDYDMIAPGLGVNYALTDSDVIFGGYYRGFSPPAPSGARAGLVEETSNSFEIGYRRAAENTGFYGEVVFFHTDLEDLVTAESIANAGSDANVGNVTTDGVELIIGADLVQLGLIPADNGWSIPVQVSGTWTDARLDGDAQSGDPESIFFGGEDGNRVPYIPEWQFFASVGVETERWRTTFSAHYVDEVYGTADNFDSSTDDVRIGLIESRVTFDWSLRIQLTEHIEWFGVVTNLFDESYAVSRLPHGLRPGAPRQMATGVTVRF